MLGLSDTFTNRHDEMNHAKWCWKGAQLTLSLAALFENMGFCTPAAGLYVVQTCATQTKLNRCLHVTCLPTQHGDGKSQKWRVTWPSGFTPYPGIKLPMLASPLNTTVTCIKHDHQRSA